MSVRDVDSTDAGGFDFLLFGFIVCWEQSFAFGSDPLSTTVEYDCFESVHCFVDFVDDFTSIVLPLSLKFFSSRFVLRGIQIFSLM